MTQRDLFEPDICSARHRGAETSRAAFGRVAPTLPAQRQVVLAFIDGWGLRGATAKEVAGYMGKGLNAVSGRLSELLADGLVCDSGRRREGCRVLVARRHLFPVEG